MIYNDQIKNKPETFNESISRGEYVPIRDFKERIRWQQKKKKFDYLGLISAVIVSVVFWAISAAFLLLESV